MARARNIKPGIMANEELAECDPLARLLFTYLWMLADRSGRLEDRPKRIGVQALPYDAADVDGLLQQLSDNGFILRYEIEGAKYIQILSFEKHQTPHHKEKASAIPSPEKESASPGQGRCKTEKSPEPAPPDSLIPDSLIPDSHDSVPTQSDDTKKLFEMFWEACKAAYSKTESNLGARANAKKQFDKLKIDETRAIELINTMHAQTAHKINLRDSGQFCEKFQHVERWLRNERWSDEITPIAIKQTQSNVEPIRKRKPFPGLRHGG